MEFIWKNKFTKKKSLSKGLFKERLIKSITSDPFEQYALAIYYIQKILREHVDGEYPVSRFMVQLEMIKKDPEYNHSKGNKNPKRFK